MSQETWNRLAEAAVRYAATRDIRDGKELRDAAEADARARQDERGQSTPQPLPSSSARLPNFGRQKGMLMSDVEVADLKFYRGAVMRSIDDPEKARFLETNRATLAAIDAAIARKGGA